MIPDLRRLSGLLDVHVGRHGPDSIGERLIASIWSSGHAMAQAMGPSADIEASIFHPEHLDLTTDRTLAVHPLEIAFHARVPDAGRILRLVHGRAREGELPTYVAEAREGTERDIASGQGPIALYLAAIAPDRFVTLSVWTGWEPIEASTGAGTHHPQATRHAERLVETAVEHFEVIPG